MAEKVWRYEGPIKRKTPPQMVDKAPIAVTRGLKPIGQPTDLPPKYKALKPGWKPPTKNTARDNVKRIAKELKTSDSNSAGLHKLPKSKKRN